MTILSLEEAKKRGHILAGAWEGEYPDDEWMALCDNWDINLWTDEDSDGILKNMASIYPVTENKKTGFGEIDTSTFYRVWEKSIE